VSNLRLKPGCEFCEPVVAHAAFAETTRFVAIYNVAPVVEGHSLVLPREHVASLLELTDECQDSFFRFARDTTRLLMKAYSRTSFDWALQDGVAAGQSIRHLHLHILPRVVGDLPEAGDWVRELPGLADESGAANRRRLSESDLALRTEWLKQISRLA
jgi:bis(5'-adenosyl)-triphosphatase